MAAVNSIEFCFSPYIILFIFSDSEASDKCAMDVLTAWRDKEDSEANMASLEKALHEIGRESLADDFKQLAYSSYSKEPVVVVETRHVSSTPDKDSIDRSDPGQRRISEFLDSAGTTDDMFGGEDDGGSPLMPGLSIRDEVFGDEQNSAEPITEETVIVVEKHQVVDEDGNVIEESHKVVQDGEEVSKEDTEKLLQDFFSNDKGVLDFLAPDNGAVENGGNTEETEI